MYFILQPNGQICLTNLVQQGLTQCPCQRRKHLYCNIVPFPFVSQDANMHPDLLLFFYPFFFSLSSLSVFFCLYSPRAFVSLSGIQSKEIHLVSLYLSVFLFYSYAFSTHVLFPLLHCYTFLHNGVSSVCPSTSPSHFKLIPFPRISSPSHPRRLTQRQTEEMKSVCILQQQHSVAAGGKTAVLWFYLWICRFLTLCTSHTGAEMKSSLI